MCHCMTEEEYEALLRQLREAKASAQAKPAVITVKA